MKQRYKRAINVGSVFASRYYRSWYTAGVRSVNYLLLAQSELSLPHRVRERVRVRPFVGKAAADKSSAWGEHNA